MGVGYEKAKNPTLIFFSNPTTTERTEQVEFEADLCHLKNLCRIIWLAIKCTTIAITIDPMLNFSTCRIQTKRISKAMLR